MKLDPMNGPPLFFSTEMIFSQESENLFILKSVKPPGTNEQQQYFRALVIVTARRL